MSQQPRQNTPDGEAAGDGQRDELAPRQADPREEIDEPARLIRIASTVQTLLQEVRTTELDEAARQRLTEIHNRAVQDLRGAVSDDLEDELQQLIVAPEEGTPSGAELRVMQAQLSGWLQGLFHGIQASLATQQMAAQQQLQRMRGEQGGSQQGPVSGQPGQYL